MEIQYVNDTNKYKTFNDLSVGDVFGFEDDNFSLLKIQNVIGSDGNAKYNAIRLDTYFLVLIAKSETVDIVYKATLKLAD